MKQNILRIYVFTSYYIYFLSVYAFDQSSTRMRQNTKATGATAVQEGHWGDPQRGIQSIQDVLQSDDESADARARMLQFTVGKTFSLWRPHPCTGILLFTFS